MKLFYFTTLMFSTLTALSANSWIILWMSLEINLMAFIPIINNTSHTTNYLFKYFIVQSTSSSIFIMSLLMTWLLELNNLFFMEYDFLNKMIFLTMSMKMGLIPFHWWYIEIVMEFSWMNFLLMSTWQKIIPLTIISHITMNSLLYMIIIMSSLISSMQGMTQNNLRKIFTLSSINHTCWLTINTIMTLNLMYIYLIIYSMLSYNIYKMFTLNNLTHIKDMYMYPLYNSQMKWLLMTNILSLAGLPPFLGFTIKLMTIKFLMLYNMPFLIITLTGSAMFALFFYLKVIYSLNFFYTAPPQLNLNMMLSYPLNKKWPPSYNFMLFTSMMNYIMPTLIFMTL
uniref:NADH-ubiquinone oxidoreductase chain 2 n=1 Tax=Janus sp. 1 GYN-2022e TaxID=3003421 RepID=A0A9E8Z0M7_9HYME|nr:NADH dehydrogenase subunit 2 [Janus sp. 1 GYN-2022e]